MHKASENEVRTATAVAGVVEELSWLLGAGWGLAAGLWFGSWFVGLGLAAVIVFLVQQPYLKRCEKAWVKLSGQDRQS